MPIFDGRLVHGGEICTKITRYTFNAWTAVKNVLDVNFLMNDPISTILSSICTPDPSPYVRWTLGAW